MNVRFWFDPICPWCWLTSRWLVEEVVGPRDLQVDWHSVSLHVRNRHLEMGEERRARYFATHRMLRVAEALREAGQADGVGAFYTALGEAIHHERVREVDIAASLEAAGLDPGFAAAADDEAYDEAVERATAEAVEVAGEDLGTPIIAYEVDGVWRGFFGPVIPEVLRGEPAVKLWDGMCLLIETPGFYELKRTRDIPPQLPVKPA